MKQEIPPLSQFESIADHRGIAARTQHRDVVYSSELVMILGLDRLARPDMAIDRLMQRGDLPRRKIGGRLVFSRRDVELLINHGTRRAARGRPPGSKNKTPSGVAVGTG